MDNVLSLLKIANIEPSVFLQALLILSVGSIVFGLIGRFVFGRQSVLSHSVSSAISIIFVYATAIVIYSAIPSLVHLIPELPYASFTDSNLVLFSFSGAHYTVICTQVLNMIIFAFLANLLDSLIPHIKNFFGWFLVKVVTVIAAALLLLLVNTLIQKFLPEGLILYSPTILLVLLIIMLLVGGLKVIVGAVLATVNPLIAAFYTFFFATIVGKALTKAVLTTAILTAAVIALGYIGCAIISIATAALIVYIPLLIILLAVWYAINRLM